MISHTISPCGSYQLRTHITSRSASTTTGPRTPPLGIAGAVIALCVANVVTLAVLHLLTRGLFHVPFEWGRLGRATLVLGVAALVGELLLPTEGFAVTEGEPELGGLHGAQRHHYCGWCKSWLFTRMEGLDWFVNVRATALDDPGWYAPFVETCTAEKLAWAATPARHSYSGLPPDADWPRLLDEFRARA